MKIATDGHPYSLRTFPHEMFPEVKGQTNKSRLQKRDEKQCRTFAVFAVRSELEAGVALAVKVSVVPVDALVRAAAIVLSAPSDRCMVEKRVKLLRITIKRKRRFGSHGTAHTSSKNKLCHEFLQVIQSEWKRNFQYLD